MAPEKESTDLNNYEFSVSNNISILFEKERFRKMCFKQFKCDNVTAPETVPLCFIFVVSVRNKVETVSKHHLFLLAQPCYRDLQMHFFFAFLVVCALNDITERISGTLLREHAKRNKGL